MKTQVKDHLALNKKCLPLGTSAVLVFLSATVAYADCTLTTTGNVPLPDLGPGVYQGFTGGLYPNGTDTRPIAHQAVGLDIAHNQIKPLDVSGNVDPSNGNIVMISVGMSNTSAEFLAHQNSFKSLADADKSKNPQLVLINGAQSGKTAIIWADPTSSVWATVNSRLAQANLTPQQVQVAWVKLAESFPQQYGSFPLHAQVLQDHLEGVARNLLINYPNIKIAYYSSRTRAYVWAGGLNPEPYAYESGFATKWMIANQINGTGNLNFDPTKGPVVAPYLSWGPYLWADGTNPRSDGFTWLCTDTSTDFIHPSLSGIRKVADQLLAFFKTDPTATPWFLKASVVGSAPTVTVSASSLTGEVPLTVTFTATASDPDGVIVGYVWTFDDGTFSNTQNPTKIFGVPGTYNVHLTVTDDNGNTVTKTVAVTARAGPGR